MSIKETPLQHINPDKIKPNPENPRLIFREDEMNQLLKSIKEGGIRVPISVYSDDHNYVLLDGERRWRCARKLNLPDIPAIVQPKPTPLENLLMMFNIHNVRVEWELMPMAIKIGRIKDMLAERNEPTTATALSAVTGVAVSTVRRAFDLLGMPEKYQQMLLEEADKPRRSQRITADAFVEIYKSLHVVRRYLPEVFERVDEEDYVEVMVGKYLSKVVNNVLQYREMSKIARAELAGVERSAAIPTVIRLIEQKEYSITEAFQDTVQFAYEQRDLTTRLRGLSDRLTTYKSSRYLNEEGRKELTRLKHEILRLLGE